MRDAKNFGKNLQKIMTTLGMTQKDLAEELGVTQACVSQLLNGVREPSLKTICKILNTIPVKFEILIGEVSE